MAESALSLYTGGSGPVQRKSAIRDWYDQVTAKALGHDKIEAAGLHVIEGMQALRQGGESMLTGGILGFIDSEMKNGLNMSMGNAEVPLDGAIAVAGLGASIVLAGHPTGIGVDSRNVGSAAMAVYSFRMTKSLLASKKAAAVSGEAGCDVHGEANDNGEDPIVAFARAM